MPDVNPIIAVRHLTKVYGAKKSDGFRAVDDVSFSVARGESYGLVGESGSGKSTTARLVMRLLEKTSGEVSVDGTSIHELSARALREFRRRIQIVFQDPFASLNPRMTIAETLADCLRFHDIGTPASRTKAAMDILNQVALGASYATRYPHELSGGQCQRVGIARALILEPKIVVLDEPVSALDVSVQAQILNLLARLQKERGLTYFFISHDLNVVRHFCDRVGIMRSGKLIEEGDSQTVFDHPQHPYTAALVEAVLDVRSTTKLADRQSSDDIGAMTGEVRNASELPPHAAN